MNTVLKLELSSPYFKSGAEKEVYSMVVMKHKDDALMSFAIDDFPDMTDDAIEKFSIEKVLCTVQSCDLCAIVIMVAGL